jgi:hypothetical protein
MVGAITPFPLYLIPIFVIPMFVTVLLVANNHEHRDATVRAIPIVLDAIPSTRHEVYL